MTTARGATALATGALLLAAVTSCAGSGNEPAANGAPPPNSPSSSTTSTLPTTESEAASQSASRVMRSYFATLDNLRQQPSKPLSDLAEVATSIQLSSQKTLLKRERQKGLHQVGVTRIGDLKVRSVNLDNSDPKAGKAPTVVIDVCWDVSAADLVDETGKSVVSEGRTDVGWTRYTVANYHWDSNRTDGWRVASGQDLEQTPCTAS